VASIQTNIEQTYTPSYSPGSQTKEEQQFQWINKYIKLLYEKSVFTIMLMK